MHSAFHADRVIQERQREALAVAERLRLVREARQSERHAKAVTDGFLLRLVQLLIRRRPRLAPAPMPVQRVQQ